MKEPHKVCMDLLKNLDNLNNLLVLNQVPATKLIFSDTLLTINNSI